jgi:hypothetical protein
MCLGRTPGYWKTHSAQLEQIGAKNLQFSAIFAGGFPGKTLKEVMELKGFDDPNKLGAHLAAAWCNWKMGWVPSTILDLGDLQAMWNGRSTGYSPVAGVTWYGPEIVTYLKTTQPL